MKKLFLTLLFWVASALFISGAMPATAKAALTYGSGYYTNLCDSGTAATYYNCNPGCSPATGSCKSDNSGVVMWVCKGKWNQCLESESQWSNYEQVGSSSCGYTVQLSLFDKKCRRLDGSWDNSCKLLGYMTWYSGDCYEGQTTSPAPTGQPIVSPSPTPMPTATPVPTKTPVPTPTGVSKIKNPTPAPTQAVNSTSEPVERMCGVKCNVASDCKIGFACLSGLCRNPACPADKSCFCTGGSTATQAAVSAKTPATGVETWLGMAGMVGLGAVGLKMRRLAKRIW